MSTYLADNEPMKRAVIYRRVSTDTQTMGASPDTQLNVCMKRAEEEGYSVVEDFYDDGKSAKNSNRKELQQLLTYCVEHKGEIDAVIVYKLDRLSRNSGDYLGNIKGFLAAQGVQIISATEQIEDSATGKLVEHMLIGLAEFDNNLKSERVADNMKAHTLDGCWQSKAPRGYDNYRIRDLSSTDKKGLPSIRPNHEAEAIADILTTFSRGGISQSQLAQYAFDKGIKSRNGTKLNLSSIGNMLRQAAYTGHISNKHTQHELIKARHKALIGLDVYYKNLEILGSKSSSTIITKRSPEYPLKSVLLHSKCGKPVYASAPLTGGGKSHSPRYQCNRCKGSGSLSATKTHEMFEELLGAVKPSTNTLKLFKEILIRKWHQETRTERNHQRSIQKQLDELDERRDKTNEKYIDDRLSFDEKERALRRIDQARISLKQELDETKDMVSNKEAIVDYATSFMTNAAKLWRDADFELKQVYQKMVFPNGIDFDFKEGFGTIKISPLYEVVSSEGLDLSNMVIPTGVEPVFSG